MAGFQRNHPCTRTILGARLREPREAQPGWHVLKLHVLTGYFTSSEAHLQLRPAHRRAPVRRHTRPSLLGMQRGARLLTTGRRFPSTRDVPAGRRAARLLSPKYPIRAAAKPLQNAGARSSAATRNACIGSGLQGRKEARRTAAAISLDRGARTAHTCDSAPRGAWHDRSACRS